MIVFDLQCRHRHVFEAWFGSSADYDRQIERGLLACPICGDDHIGKAAMAPAVPVKGNRGGSTIPASERTETEEIKAELEALAEFQAEIEGNSDYVGDRFAEEARALHLGEAPPRAIHGEATIAEAEALADEGIEVRPLPFRARRRRDG
jgi:hypothetical protein